MAFSPQKLSEDIIQTADRVLKTDVRYLASAGSWSNAGTLLTAFLGLGLYIIFGRFLSQEQYGIYQYLLSLSVFINALTLTGMNAAVTRAVAQGHEAVFVRSIKIQLLFGILPAFLSLLASGYYAYKGNEVLSIGLMVLGLTTPLANAFNTYAAYLTGKEDFRRGFLYNAIGNIPFYGAIALAAIVFQEALPVFIANGVVNVVVQYAAYKHTASKLRGPLKDDPRAYRYGVHLSIMSIPAVLLAQADNLLAFQVLGATGLAVYAFATAIPDQLGRFLKFVPAIALTRFSRADSDAVRNGLLSKVLLLTTAGLLMSICYITFAPYLFNLLFPQYHEALFFSQIYSLSLLGIGTGLITATLTAQKKTKSLYAFSIGTASLQTILQTVGVFLYGMWGLVLGKLLATAFSFSGALLLYFATSKDTQTDPTPDARTKP